MKNVLISTILALTTTCIAALNAQAMVLPAGTFRPEMSAPMNIKTVTEIFAGVESVRITLGNIDGNIVFRVEPSSATARYNPVYLPLTAKQVSRCGSTVFHAETPISTVPGAASFQLTLTENTKFRSRCGSFGGLGSPTGIRSIVNFGENDSALNAEMISDNSKTWTATLNTLMPYAPFKGSMQMDGVPSPVYTIQSNN